MDIKSFLKLLNRFKWLLIIVPILTAVITFFLVKNLPQVYDSEAQIATGIIDQSKQVVVGGNQNMDFFKISQQFSNIIERMKMRKVMSVLSYTLICHDLDNPKGAFKPYSKNIDSLSENERKEISQLYHEKLLRRDVLTISDNKGKFRLFDLIVSMGYDQDNLNKKLNIYRPDGSDFINVYFSSENPELSAFVVNTLSEEFINSYGRDVSVNQNNSIALLDSLLKKKESLMNQKNAALKDFKMKNGVLNLDKQSEMVYGQISANEERKAQAIRDIQSNQMAIADIDAKLRSGASVGNTGGSTVDNLRIVDLKNQLKNANSAYIDGGFKPSDKRRVDSLSRLIGNASSRIVDENVVNPQVSRQALIQQKLNLETVVSQAKGSIRSIDNELSLLKSKYNQMVPFDAGIQNYERDAEAATKDYMIALDTYNQNNTEKNIALKLQLAQPGLPGPANPSKSIIYVGLGGISSFFVCFSFLLLSFILDKGINNAKQLAAATKSPVLGSLNYLDRANISVRSIWKDNEHNPEFAVYKDLLRSLRFEISRSFANDNAKILGVTSLKHGVGKSFIASSLAYAFAMIGKKVLLIGGEVPVKESGKKALGTGQDFETFIVKREIQTEDLITILNKNDAHTSLLEKQDSRSLRAGFDVLREEFDIIIIDVNSLSDINIAKEWLLFTEKNIALYEAGHSLTEQDLELVDYIKSQPEFMGWVINKVKLEAKG